ncbi:MAG TPA: NUDIX hydrolase [Gammaproteobacteria bacterium]|nr:NUDIX hydrolase [Gammaproteobacteria bacterium]MCH77302.1 NUDIX hydrolase [Gammaproteobacteria bacterium]
MKHCSQCGSPVELIIPEGDNRERHVCANCGTIHYQNPRIVVGCIAQWQERIILCRRAIEPRYGYWTLPAGFLENSESTEQGAARESLEEACIDVQIGDLFTIISVPHIDQVHLMYRAELRKPEYGVGDESLEVDLFAEDDIPWQQMAFPTVVLTLEHYFEDRRKGHFGVHSEVLIPGQHRPARGS